MIKLTDILREVINGGYMYHGTSSGRSQDIIKSSNELYVTDVFDVAAYYAMMGGEDTWLDVERKFEQEHGVTPQEYYDIDENGEAVMYKALYPKGEYPVVIKIRTNDVKQVGYAGIVQEVSPNQIVDVVAVNWDDYD